MPGPTKSPVGIQTGLCLQSVMDMNGGKTVERNPAQQKPRLRAEEVPKRTGSLLSRELLEGLMVFQDSHLTFDPWQPTFPRLPQLVAGPSHLCTTDWVGEVTHSVSG